MDRVELLMRRRTVWAFICADPIKLVVHRKPAPVRLPGTGGYVQSPDVPPLSTQTARIVQNVRRYTAGIVNAEAGDIPNSEYRLVGMHNLNLQKDDTFMWRGENYRVLGIHEAREESTFAAISLLGPDNRA